MSVSIKSEHTLEELLEYSDAALYEAKADDSSMPLDIVERLYLLARLVEHIRYRDWRMPKTDIPIRHAAGWSDFDLLAEQIHVANMDRDLCKQQVQKLILRNFLPFHVRVRP
jgi:hypothetical protein